MYKVKTPHYTFTLQVLEKQKPYHVITFFVGKNEQSACLDLHAFFTDLDERLLGHIDPSVATLEKIHSLEECSMFELTEDYTEKYSFGKEILLAIISILATNIPHIKTLRLNDKSVIPCNRTDGITLDLLTYSIALYGKTWYEKKFNAYIHPPVLYTEYKSKINEYMKEEFKTKISFEDIKLLPTKYNNRFAESMFENKKELYSKLFADSKTMPEFFKALNDMIPRKEKCNFFKSWLEKFIYSHIPIQREWRIDIYNNEKFYNVLGNIRSRPMVRKTRKRKTRRNYVDNVIGISGFL